MVEIAIMEINVQGGEGLLLETKQHTEHHKSDKTDWGLVTYHSSQPMQNKGHGGVVSAIEEGRHLVIYPSLKLLFTLGQEHWVQRTNGLGTRTSSNQSTRAEVVMVTLVRSLKVLGSFKSSLSEE